MHEWLSTYFDIRVHHIICLCWCCFIGVCVVVVVVATNVTADDDDDENGYNYADTSVFTDDYVDAAASFVCVTDADDSAVAHKTNVDPVNVRVILYIIFSLLYTPFWW